MIVSTDACAFMCVRLFAYGTGFLPSSLNDDASRTSQSTSDQGINDERRALRTTNENMMLMMYCTNPGDRLDDDLSVDESKKTTTTKRRKMSSSSKRSARSQSSENRQRRLSHKEGESHLTHAPSLLISTNEKVTQGRSNGCARSTHTPLRLRRSSPTEIRSNFIVDNRMKSRQHARSSFSG